MLLTWLGTAGFKVDTSEGATLLIDPYLSRPARARPRLPVKLTDLAPVDEIFLTNGRFDHGTDAPALSRQTGAIVHAAAPVCQILAEKGVSNHSLESISLKIDKRIGTLRWQALPSLANQADSSPVLRALVRKPALLPRMRALDRQWPLGDVVAYLFEAEGLSIIHFGSAAWLDSEVDRLQPDIALIPVESEPDPTAPAVQLTALLNPKIVIPHHWDDYYPPLSRIIDLMRFKAVLQSLAPNVEVFVPTIGQGFDPADLL